MGTNTAKTYRWLGEKISKRRKQMGFRTQSEFGQRLGVDQSRISVWESGQEFPRDYQQKIMEVLQVDESFFQLHIPAIGQVNFEHAAALLLAYQKAPQPARELIEKLLHLDQAYPAVSEFFEASEFHQSTKQEES